MHLASNDRVLGVVGSYFIAVHFPLQLQRQQCKRLYLRKYNSLTDAAAAVALRWLSTIESVSALQLAPPFR
jgi:hypothetical protein